MKNCELAEFGALVRAIEQTPRTCGSLENSALRSGRSEPPDPVPVGIAGLGHETVDDAMEHDAVVEALAGERRDALDMAGGEIGTKPDHHAALGGFENEGVLGIGCHGVPCFCGVRACHGRA
jgi:hypothetical protein